MNFKRLMGNIGYLSSFIGVLYYLFFVPDPTNKQLLYFISCCMSLIILSIQKDNQ